MPSIDDPLGPLRQVLRRPDRRTWRRFLPEARGAHRSASTERAPIVRNARAETGDVADLGRGPRAWQVVAGVLVLAAGIVLATGLLPVEPAPGRDELTLRPAPPDTLEEEPPNTTTSSPTVRVWPVERVEVEGRIVRSERGQWEVGAEGDVVVIGDWDCDRSPTPAVLRPTDGRIAVFDRWATPDGDEAARPVGTVTGATTLQPARTCGEVVVRTAAGEATVLDTRTSPSEGSP